MPCREGGRGTETDFTLLLPSRPLPMQHQLELNWKHRAGAEGAVDESQPPEAQSRVKKGRGCM